MYGIDLNSFIRKANKLTAAIEKRKQELANETVEGKSGDGLVTVVATATQEIKSLKIDPKAASDLALLEDLVIAAVNSALTQSKEHQKKELAKISEGIQIPGIT